MWTAIRSSPAVTADGSASGSFPAGAAMVQPFVATRLSIIVLPFANLTDDQEQQYFADGITDDLTTDLSRISESFVIARNTAFTYRGKSVDVKRIGRELGMRYVLEGSARRSAEKVRVNSQLGEARKLSDLNSSIARLNAAPGQQWLQRPKIRALAEATYFVGLRKAGMAEE
jgi:adenylate cyclase